MCLKCVFLIATLMCEMLISEGELINFEEDMEGNIPSGWNLQSCDLWNVVKVENVGENVQPSPSGNKNCLQMKDTGRCTARSYQMSSLPKSAQIEFTYFFKGDETSLEIAFSGAEDTDNITSSGEGWKTKTMYFNIIGNPVWMELRGTILGEGFLLIDQINITEDSRTTTETPLPSTTDETTTQSTENEATTPPTTTEETRTESTENEATTPPSATEETTTESTENEATTPPTTTEETTTESTENEATTPPSATEETTTESTENEATTLPTTTESTENEATTLPSATEETTAETTEHEATTPPSTTEETTSESTENEATTSPSTTDETTTDNSENDTTSPPSTTEETTKENSENDTTSPPSTKYDIDWKLALIITLSVFVVISGFVILTLIYRRRRLSLPRFTRSTRANSFDTGISIPRAKLN